MKTGGERKRYTRLSQWKSPASQQVRKLCPAGGKKKDREKRERKSTHRHLVAKSRKFKITPVVGPPRGEAEGQAEKSVKDVGLVPPARLGDGLQLGR